MSERAKEKRITSKWIGKEIVLPEGLKNVSPWPASSANPDSYKVLVYAPNYSCMSCMLNFGLWTPLINESDRLFGDKLRFIFYVNTDKEKEIYNLADLNDISGEVYLDPGNLCFTKNKLPNELKYRYFLLDTNNKVVALGNPSTKEEIWHLYKDLTRKGVGMRKIR